LTIQYFKIVNRTDFECSQHEEMINEAGCWWLMPVIQATQEAEIRRIAVQSQPWANSS
jgi:hypothetical protein